MSHIFFEDIDFKSDLSKLGVKDLLIKTEPVEEADDSDEVPERIDLNNV